MYSRLRELLQNLFVRLGNQILKFGRSGDVNDHDQVFKFLVNNSNQVIFWTDEDGRFIDFNDAACEFLGYSRPELAKMVVADIDPTITAESHQALIKQLAQDQTVTVQSQPSLKDSSHLTMEFIVKRLEIENRVYLCTYGREIDLEKQLRDQVLEAIATGMPLTEILVLIVELAEKSRIGMLGSIMLLGESGRLRIEAQVQLPEKFCDQIDGILPGPNVGSCGTAVFTQKSVMVSDISRSPLWNAYVDLATAAGLQACWSEPIFSTSNEVLGTLAMYFREPQIPTQHDFGLMKTFAHLASIAIEKSRENEALRQSEHQLRMITDSLPVMIAYIDTNYCFQFNNAMYELRFNKSRNEIRGQHLSDLIGRKMFQEIKHHFESAFAGTATTYEHRLELAGGQSQIREIRLVPDEDQLGNVVGVYALVDNITERRALEKEVLNVASREQRRIGQDLHDGTGQELTGLGMIADTLVVSLSRQQTADGQIAEKLARGIKRCLKQVRSTARGLNPVDISAPGLNSALIEMAEHVEQLYGITCRIHFDSDAKLDDHQIATQLFRIAQEATTNAVKHGHAENVIISFDVSDSEITLAVTDDGNGFQSSVRENTGMGLRTMKYRAGVVGGKLHIAGCETGGTRITCKISRSCQIAEASESVHAPSVTQPKPHKTSASTSNFQAPE